MRILEWITIILLLVAWAGLFIPAKKPLRRLVGITALPLIAAALQGIVEQYRWSMIPAYGLAVLFFSIGISRIWTRKPEQPAGLGYRIVKGTGAVLGLAAAAIAAALPAAFPVFSLPETTGPYAVGTTSFEWVDKAREELFTPDPGDPRDLLVQVWYPAEMVAGAEPLPMWPDAGVLGQQVSKTFGMPAFLFDQLALVQSHAYPDAPLAASPHPFPVLVFSHAYTPGYAGQNGVQMEELASHGYVIFSIAHPYEAAAVIYPDGRILTYSEDRYTAVIRDGTMNDRAASRAVSQSATPKNCAASCGVF